MSGLYAHQRKQPPFLESAIASMPVDSLRVITLPAPVCRPENLLLGGADPRALFLASGEDGVAGLGVGVELRADGPARFERIQELADDVFRSINRLDSPKVHAPPPRFYGGFAFDEGAADDSSWEAFGDALFVMPRWLYGRSEGRAWLRLTLRAGDFGDAAPSEYADYLERLAQNEMPQSDAKYRRRPTESPESYRERIDLLREDIKAGRYEKVVAARRVEVDLEAPIDDLVPLMAFRERFPDCTRFAFRIDQRTFLGATPERLVRRQGQRVETVALAGTVPHGKRDELIASTKDAWEHRLVVDAIHDSLREAVELSADSGVVVRELANVLHLETPIEGQLRDDAHILSLVRSLHPTPAVGGVPRKEALDHIRTSEAPRGWYASPIGSFDAAGEGEFSVALRCGLLAGDSATAYAGGGIVRDSKADLEYQESELKFEAFLGALGSENLSSKP
ncbi:MAG: isochorismate synthase [Polyangiales bacterium]|jgi:isochorismate synthase